MAEMLALAERLSGAGLATLLILILYGGFRKWWVFGYQMTECETRCAALITAANQREAEWKQIARDGGQLAKTAVDMARESTRS
jgi:hypothetical protein